MADALEHRRMETFRRIGKASVQDEARSAIQYILFGCCVVVVVVLCWVVRARFWRARLLGVREREFTHSKRDDTVICFIVNDRVDMCFRARARVPDHSLATLSSFVRTIIALLRRARSCVASCTTAVWGAHLISTHQL